MTGRRYHKLAAFQFVSFCLAIVVPAGRGHAERIVRIELPREAPSTAFEVEWLEEENSPSPMKVERSSSPVILRSLPESIILFRFRTVRADGTAGAWSEPAPIERFIIASITDEELLCIVTQGSLTFEIRTADGGYELRMVSPKEGLFADGKSVKRGRSYPLVEGNLTAVQIPGEMDARLFLLFSAVRGPDVQIFTLRSTGVELVHSVRVSVFHRPPP